jgi:hypothetical protein
VPYLIGGVLLLVVLVYAGRAFIDTDPQKLSRFFRWFALALGGIGAAALLILLIASERLGPALALMGFLAPVVLRGRAMLRRWQSTAGPSPGSTSGVETDYLRMELDHDTGAMRGTVRRGRYSGRLLDEMAGPELVELWRECRIADAASARLMESYLDRLDPDWRDGAGEAAGAGPRAASADSMTRDEAYAILGLKPGADQAAVKKAHRELMMKLHPDLGGSTYLAAKINRAKEILLA